MRRNSDLLHMTVLRHGTSGALKPVADLSSLTRIWREGAISSRPKTRMVQLPATVAIEYVAACWVSGAGGIFVRGCFCPGGLLPGGTFVRGAYVLPPKFNAYTNRLGFLCLAS